MVFRKNCSFPPMSFLKVWLLFKPVSAVRSKYYLERDNNV